MNIRTKSVLGPGKGFVSTPRNEFFHDGNQHYKYLVRQMHIWLVFLPGADDDMIKGVPLDCGG